VLEPEIVRRARDHRDKLALVGRPGSSPRPSPADEHWTRGELLAASAALATALLAGDDDLDEARVPFLVAASPAWVAVQWGIWRAGGVAVPLATSHPPAELERVLDDADPRAVVASGELAARVEPAARDRGLRFLRADDLLPGVSGDDEGAPARVRPASGRRAMMLYTSGTTGRPKGVVTTHANLEAQVRCLVEAWEWSEDDRILGVLPLHHVHGIVNVVCCALWAGACCELRVPFDPGVTWERLASGEVSVFMAVPTLYVRLIRAWEEASSDRQRRWARGAAGLRLMVSGSASLPVPVLERWEDITGHRLLERYGMTEIGMALSNPLDGERLPGTVGRPLPAVEARVVDDIGRPVPAGETGEIEVRGPQLFLEYWRRPEATAAAFRDGWFRTGDEGAAEDDVWRILGRRSVDIVKSGGEKVSALEVEATLRAHPAVSDVAVVGVPDPEWGERVVAAVVPRSGSREGASGEEATGPEESRGLPEALREWCKERLAPWKVPRAVKLVGDLPRNAMGKVVKSRLQRRLADDGGEMEADTETGS